MHHFYINGSTMVVTNGPDIFVIAGKLCDSTSAVSSVYHYDATNPATSPKRMDNDSPIGKLAYFLIVLALAKAHLKA